MDDIRGALKGRAFGMKNATMRGQSVCMEKRPQHRQSSAATALTPNENETEDPERGISVHQYQ